ncbi:hypothetical protein ACFV0H_21440 [Streptomyces erythrochromogenes]|uniref:hypothetical protein n=1 Tax=Streptomyces erythrochromogenes TaxID=285574 RepID=UPI0004CDC2B7|nr:hypothetical protein [Streptomyces erythrochromogenes]
MTDGRGATVPPGDRRWVRWTFGLPLALVHALNAVFVYAAVFRGPQAAWDHQGYEGTAAAVFIALCLSLLGVLITLVPPVRRALGPWWFAPPLVLGVIAWVRIETLG